MFKRTRCLSNASVLSTGKQTNCGICVSQSLITLCVTARHRIPDTTNRTSEAQGDFIFCPVHCIAALDRQKMKSRAKTVSPHQSK